MKRILEYEHQIRDYVLAFKQCYTKELDEWNALWVAMDTLADTCLALEYYEDFGFGEEDGEKYIKLYGTLQAVFLQQDSINQIGHILMGEVRSHDKDSPWLEIRNLRNLTVGHPIDKGREPSIQRCFVSRKTITNTGFNLIIWNKNQGKDDFRSIDLESLYEKYKNEALRYLEKIYQAQIRKFGSV